MILDARIILDRDDYGSPTATIVKEHHVLNVPPTIAHASGGTFEDAFSLALSDFAEQIGTKAFD